MFNKIKDMFTWADFLKAVARVKGFDPKKDIGGYLGALKIANQAAEKLLTGKKREKAKKILAALALLA